MYITESGIVDSRDLQERIDELDSARDTFMEETDEESEDDAEAAWNESQDGEELKALKEMRDEVGPEWQYGVALIPDDEFVDYAEQLAGDIYTIPYHWPFNCIDWDRAADQLESDYSSLEFQGKRYLYQS